MSTCCVVDARQLTSQQREEVEVFGQRSVVRERDIFTQLASFWFTWMLLVGLMYVQLVVFISRPATCYRYQILVHQVCGPDEKPPLFAANQGPTVVYCDETNTTKKKKHQKADYKQSIFSVICTELFVLCLAVMSVNTGRTKHCFL